MLRRSDQRVEFSGNRVDIAFLYIPNHQDQDECEYNEQDDSKDSDPEQYRIQRRANQFPRVFSGLR